MSETPTKIVVDLSKPAGQREQIVPLTAEEIAERDERARIAAEEAAAEEASAEARAAAKASAEDKLASLGLTTEEIKALLS